MDDSVHSDDQLYIHLLGEFKIQKAGRIVNAFKLRLRKARDIVKVLSLSPQHSLLREQLMEIFWKDTTVENASHSLNNALYMLRKTLINQGIDPGLLVQTDEEIVQLCPEPTPWIDVEAFKEATKRAQRSHNSLDIVTAINLYSGDLLPENIYDDWAFFERENLKNTFNNLLQELAEIQETSGEFLKAIEIHRQLVEAEPALEKSHVSLMKLYAQTGQSIMALQQYELLKKVLHTELEVEPQPESQQLFRDIKMGRYSKECLPFEIPPGSSPKVEGKFHFTIPRRVTTFIGREREINQILELIEEHALVTLFGPGGVGKTSLAFKVVERIRQSGNFSQDRFQDRIYALDLSRITTPEYILPTVAQVLDVSFQSGRPIIERIIIALGRGCCLLILDNCEHLVQDLADIVHQLIYNCEQLHILATSRLILGVPGEIRYEVPPLDFPDSTQYKHEELINFSAVRLFVARGRCVIPSFQLVDQNAEAISRICQRLEGIPLAIEMAASRLSVLSPVEIDIRLGDSFYLVARHLLTRADRTGLPRHQTLWATINWSYQLLSESEKALLRRLYVFTGGWSLEAAQSVCAGAEFFPGNSTVIGGEASDNTILDLLAQLVDHSLVQAETSDSELTRYRMLDTVRQYAREQLILSGEEPVLAQRHHDWFVHWVEAGYPKFYNHQIVNWLDQLEADFENIRKARDWAKEQGKLTETSLRLAGSLMHYFPMRGDGSEGTRWRQEGLKLKSQEPEFKIARARTCYMEAFSNMFWSEDIHERHRLQETAKDIFHELGADFEWELALALSIWLTDRKLSKEAQPYLGEFMNNLQVGETIARRLGTKGLIVLARILQGRYDLAILDEDWTLASQLMEDAWSLHQKSNYTIEAGPLHLLEIVKIKLGQYDEAQQIIEKALEICKKFDNRMLGAFLGNDLSVLACRRGDLTDAMRILYQSSLMALDKGEAFWAGWLIINLVTLCFNDLFLKKIGFSQDRVHKLLALGIAGCREIHYFTSDDADFDPDEAIPKLLENITGFILHVNNISPTKYFDEKNFIKFIEKSIHLFTTVELEEILQGGMNIPIREALNLITGLSGLR